MTPEVNPYALRAEEFRKNFDLSFAAIPLLETKELEKILVFGLLGNPVAIRLREISGITKSHKIVPIPGNTRGFLGLSGIRGEFVPVYSLTELLGYQGGEPSGMFLLIDTPALTALSIEGIERCMEVASESFSLSRGESDSAGSHEIIVIDKIARTVIHVASLVKSLSLPKEA